MIQLQPPLATAQAATIPASADAVGRWLIDDDVALGCECANPALQIERWGQEEGAQPLQKFY